MMENRHYTTGSGSYLTECSDKRPAKSITVQKLIARKKIAFTLIMLPICLVMAEIAARVTGHHPWKVRPLNIKVEPGGRFYMHHPSLGYSHLPGQFRVTLDDNYIFRATNLNNTLRITHPLAGYHSSMKGPEIWIFGDSITYGWSVNDEDTYAWLLQGKNPNYEFVNFGVNGYGTLHSLIQLKEALQQRSRPRLVILTYASWVDVRNTFVRGRRKMLATASSLGPVNQPYARLNTEGKIESRIDTVTYREFPLMGYSAFINMVEEAYDRYEERRAQSHEITKAIIKEFSERCKANGTDLVVATLTSDPTTSDMEEFCQAGGIKAVSIYVDLTIKENNNLPFDTHPSAAAHKEYAQKLNSYLSCAL